MAKNSISWTGSTTTYNATVYPEYTNFGANKRGYHLDQVRAHSSKSTGGGTFTVKLASAKGSAYNAVFTTQLMTSVADFFYLPTRPIKCFNGDGINLSWTNTTASTLGVEVIYRVD